MRELIMKLVDLEAEGEDEEIPSDMRYVVGYLLGDGVSMELKSVFIDGSTLHFDWERRES